MYAIESSFYVDIIHRDIVLYVTYLLFLILILYSSPLPNGLFRLSSYIASPIFFLSFCPHVC